MRKRTTWTNHNAADETGEKDIYDMNVEHPQPGATDYETGDPSAWAEDVNSLKSIDVEYQGGAVKRNDAGMAEMRDDTWNHRGTKPWGTGGGSYDNQRLAAQKAAEVKAMGCERIAKALLRTDNEKVLEPVMTGLMALPSKTITATLKSMDRLSPANLTREGRFRRALACTKLSSLLLTENAKEESLERLATVFASLDDQSLKSILKIVATERVAAEEEEDDGPDSTESCDKYPPTASAPVAKKEEEKEEEKEETASAQQSAGVLEEDDLGKLRDLMIEVEKAEEEGTLDELSGEEKEEGKEEEKEEEEEEEKVEAGPEGLDITFDEDMGGESTASVASSGDDLSDLFQTDEGRAQQEILAQQGFSPVATTRTASTGARKLGAVRASKAGTKNELDSIWDRPE